jgi:hypothetical protein
MGEPLAEIFLRYEKEARTFEFRMGIGGDTVRFHEAKVFTMREAMAADPVEGKKKAELFDFLVEQAKNDPEERFVSASNAPIEKGQVTITS